MCSLTIHWDVGLRLRLLLLLLRLRGMLSEVDRRGCAEVEVEELGASEELEVSVVECEVVLSGLIFVRRDGVEVGQVGRHIRCAAGIEAGHGVYGRDARSITRRCDADWQDNLRLQPGGAGGGARWECGRAGCKALSLFLPCGGNVMIYERERPANKESRESGVEVSIRIEERQRGQAGVSSGMAE